MSVHQWRREQRRNQAGGRCVRQRTESFEVPSLLTACHPWLLELGDDSIARSFFRGNYGVELNLVPCLALQDLPGVLPAVSQDRRHDSLETGTCTISSSIPSPPMPPKNSPIPTSVPNRLRTLPNFGVNDKPIVY